MTALRLLKELGLTLSVAAAHVGVTQGQVPAPQASRAPDIYFAATRQAVVDQMLALAEVRPTDLVVDLGSGDGRIVIVAAQKHGARGLGVEIDGGLVARSNATAVEAGVADRVTFRQGDLYQTDLSQADVVTLYLSPSINAELEGKLRRELRPGARIVSHQFPIGRWTPDRTIRGADGTDLHLWIVR
jgi:SAM-dependent methyltransferase